MSKLELKFNIKSESSIMESTFSFVLEKSIVPTIVKGGVYDFISQSNRHLIISPVGPNAGVTKGAYLCVCVVVIGSGMKAPLFRYL